MQRRKEWPLGRAGRKVVLAAAALAIATFGGSAVAQTVESPAEDPYGRVDANNVNLITGKLSLTSQDLSIGDVSGSNLAPCWSDGGWHDRRGDCSVAEGFRDLRSNIEGMNSAGLELIRYYHQGLGATPATVKLVGGLNNWSSSIILERGRYVISFGNQTFYFSGPAGGYATTRGDGAILEPLGNNSFRLTTREGTQLIFPAGYRPVNSIVYPNGRTISISHAQRNGCGHVGCMDIVYLRPQQIMSSDNYGLLFEYASDDGTADNLGEWGRIVRVTAFSRSVDACDPSLMHCTFTRTWPAVTYDTTATAHTITSPAGRRTTHELDGARITRILDPDGNVAQSISYYPQTDTARQNMVMSVTRAGGTWSYNPSGPPTSSSTIVTMTVTDPLNGVRVTRGTPRVGLMEVVDEVNRTTYFSHDAETRLFKITRPDGGYQLRTYDARGNVTEVREVAAVAGDPDLVVSATFPPTCTNRLTCNRPITATNARSYVTEFAYDPGHGGILSVTRPPAANGVRPQMRYSYTQSGGTYRLTGASSCRTLAASACLGTDDELRTIFGFSGPNMLATSIRTTSGTGSPSATFSASYDDLGNLVSSTDALSNTEYLFYDLDRRIRGLISADPDGTGPLPRRALRFTYNGAGRRTNLERGSVTGTTYAAITGMAAVQSLVTTYDSQGRKTSDADRSGSATYATVQYSYDLEGQLECTAIRMNPATYGSLPVSACTPGTAGSFGADRVSRIYHDAAGRPLRREVALGTNEMAVEEAWTYTTNGQVRTVTDGENNQTTYEYDGHDRLEQTRYPVPANGAGTSSTTDFEHLTLDANGNVTQRRLRDGQVIIYSYDQLDRMILRNLPSSEVDVSYAYDLHGRPMTTTQGSATIQLAYDGLGRLVSETSPRGTMTFQNDLMGRRTRTTWPDSFFVTREYLGTGELRAVRETGASSGAGVLATYGYDGIGRMISLTRGNMTTTTFTHDAVSRRSGIFHDFPDAAHDVNYALAYNPADEMSEITRSNDAYAWGAHYAVVRPYSRNGLNQLTDAGGVSLAYLDRRGNLTNSGTSAYAYTVENRLRSAPGGVTLSYDPTGRLAETIGPAGTTRFQYAGRELVGEYSGTNARLRRYVHGAEENEVLVWYEGSGTADRRWLHHDERGSVVAISNVTGAVTAINSYDEFGIPGHSNSGRFQFTGQPWLPEVGLYHFQSRAYSPTLGRFMQTDPSGYEDGVNWYNYAHSDPVNLIDPTGRQASAVRHGVNFARRARRYGDAGRAARETMREFSADWHALDNDANTSTGDRLRAVADIIIGTGLYDSVWEDTQGDKIKGNLPRPDEIGAEERPGAIEDLERSIAQRQQEMRDARDLHLRGGGSPQDPQFRRERDGHQNRIEQERRLKAALEVLERLDRGR